MLLPYYHHHAPTAIFESLPMTSDVHETRCHETWKKNAMTANGWSNMVEEELLPPTAGDDRQRLVRPCQACLAARAWHAPGVASCE